MQFIIWFVYHLCFQIYFLPPEHMIYHSSSQTSKDLVECKNMTHICHIWPSPFNKLHGLMLVILTSKIEIDKCVLWNALFKNKREIKIMLKVRGKIIKKCNYHLSSCYWNHAFWICIKYSFPLKGNPIKMHLSYFVPATFFISTLIRIDLKLKDYTWLHWYKKYC